MMMSANQDAILHILKQLGGEARVSQITKLTGSSNVSMRLSRLVKWGLVIKVSRGIYRVK